MIRLRWWAVWVLNRLGDSPGQAVMIGERLAADQERLLGPDHPDTLASRNNLAEAYRLGGRSDEAITMGEQTLAAQARVLGPDHPSTLTSRNSLANAYRAAGRTAEAITLHEQTLAARERLLGPDHPDTLQSRHQPRRRLPGGGPHRRGDHLARADPRRPGADPRSPTTPTPCSRATTSPSPTGAGRAAEAITLHEQTLAARERVLGPDHPHTLTSRNNLAAAYLAAGRTDEAKKLNP